MAKEEETTGQQDRKPNALDRGLQLFSEMLIKRMEEIQLDWKQPWIGGGIVQGLPQNITGRTYEGCNAFLLFLHTSEMRYHVPVYMTAKQARENGALIKKGEKSIPVFKWGLSIKDKDGKRMSESDYRELTKEEQDECKVRPYLKVFSEFNIDQTNMAEAKKSLYDSVLNRFKRIEVPKETDGMYANAALDRMMEKQEWVCPIIYQEEEKGAYYSPSRDEVVVPTKAQFHLHPNDPEESFKDGQGFYYSALHEMAHSTGHESRLNRDHSGSFGSPKYAKEELVAELTSAMICNTLGFDSRISENNVAYLQNWMSALHEEPKFIVSIMSDVNKASKMIIEKIDEQRIALGEQPLIQGALDGVEEKAKNEQQFEEMKEKAQDQKQEETAESHQEEDPKEEVAKHWASLDENPTVEMPSGDVLTVTYNKEKDEMEVEFVNEQGKKETYSEPYDHDRDINGNLGYIWEGLSNKKQFQVQQPEVEDLADLTNPKEYFSTLMQNITDGQHEEHTALDIKNMTELREYFKDNSHIGNWVTEASNKELIEAGADMLPNLRYSHKEGRTLYNIEATYSDIDARYEDVTDERTRQIAHRVRQAEAIVRAYHVNIENAHEQGFLFKEEAAHKLLPREEYTAKVSQEVVQSTNTQQNMEESEKYYFSYQYLQSTDSTEELDELQKKGDYEGLLRLADAYDNGDSLSQSDTRKNAKQSPTDDILDENDNYAVVYNNSVGGTYELLRKVSKEQILDDIKRYGLDSDASDDVKKIAYEDVAKQFSEIKKMPAFTMPNEDVVYFQYNQEENKLEAGSVTNIGLSVQHSFDYDVDRTLDDNLENAYEQLSELPEYQQVEEEEEEESLDQEPTDEEKQTNKQDTATIHEDGNIQTDVAGKTKEIASTGVPVEQAEKQAQTIVNNEQHKKFHEEEAKAAEQKKSEESKKAEADQQQKKEAGTNQEEIKMLPHSALLFGALEKAKEHDGVWMNLGKKSNAEFINTHTPITAYNNIMMVLNSDANKYKTNVYTYYDSAKQNGMPVMKNQTSMHFHWTNWQYQHAMDKSKVITNKQYKALPEDEKSFYVKHAFRENQHIYNIDQTTMDGSKHEEYVELIKAKGRQPEKPVKKTAKMNIKPYDAMQEKHPGAIILARNKETYEIYRDKAKEIAPILGLKLQEKTVKGEKVAYANFPCHKLDDLLPKLINRSYKVAIVDQMEDTKTASRTINHKEVLNNAYSIAKTVAQQSGMQYERVMVMQEAKYDAKEDKIVVSGMKAEIGNEAKSNLYKANDIYRSVVASVGAENRLDRSGRNSLLPEDDAKHEKLVQELAAGVLMARQGLPATLSKENQSLIPYWQRELKENPRMMGIVERDVNNAVQVIDDLVAKRKVNYEAIRGQLPEKTMTLHPENYSIVNDLAKLPNIETKEVVVIRDRAHKTADVLLPAGASLRVDNEVPGMNKGRIAHALGKEGIKEVGFYNASGALGLNKPNEYFQGKEVTVNKLKQYELLVHQTLDLTQQAEPKKEANIQIFEAITDNNGKYAFFIKPENEPSFSVYPTKEHLNKFYNVLNTDNQATIHKALAQKYYEMATKHPDAKKDLITPKEVKGFDMKTIERANIVKSAQNPNEKIIFATINGEKLKAPVTKMQWKKMWLANDMAAYKKGLAAVIFAPMLKQGLGQEPAKQVVKEQEKVQAKEAPAPEKKPEEEERENASRGMHR